MPRFRKKYRPVEEESYSSRSYSSRSWDDGGESTLATTEGESSLKTKEESGFSVMGFVLFSTSASLDLANEEEDEEEASIAEELTRVRAAAKDDSSRRSSSTREGKIKSHKKLDLRHTFKKQPAVSYQRQEDDEASAESNETSDTALFRYLAESDGGGLPVSGPDILGTSPTANDPPSVKSGKSSKHGWWKRNSSNNSNNNTKQKNQKHTAETHQREVRPPKVHPRAYVPTQGAVHPWTKSNTYVAPKSLVSTEEDKRDDGGTIQRIQAWQENRQASELDPYAFTYDEYDIKPRRKSLGCIFPAAQSKSMDDDWSEVGSLPGIREPKPAVIQSPTNDLDMVTAHNSKSCMLWPKQREHREDNSGEVTDDDDADSFLQFSPGRRPRWVEQDVKEKSDLLDRMDEFEQDIQGTRRKGCTVWPKNRSARTDSRDQPGSNERDFLGMRRGDSFSDLVQERKDKKCFPSWPPSKTHREVDSTDDSGETEALTDHGRERADEYINKYDKREDDASAGVKIREGTKGRHCWPKPTSYSPVQADEANSLDGTAEDDSKRCFPLRNLRQKPYVNVPGTAKDAREFVEKQEPRAAVVAAPPVPIPHWVSKTHKPPKEPITISKDDERNTGLSVAAASARTGGAASTTRSRVSQAHLYPSLSLLDLEDEEDTYDSQGSYYSNGSGWFTLESLISR